MSNEYSPLALDDLVHIMSPSPAPALATLDDSQLPLHPKSASPEPQNYADIQEMRMNVTSMSAVGGCEKEPADMVRHVTLNIITGHIYRCWSRLAPWIQTRSKSLDRPNLYPA